MNIEFELPQPIGKVIILDVFEYIDGPKVFSCKNKKGQIFIVNWIDTSSTNDTWFYALISMKNLKLLKQRKLSLRHVTLNPKNQTLFEVITPIKGYGDVIINLKNINTIEEEDLPDIDSYLQNHEVIVSESIVEIKNEKELEQNFGKKVIYQFNRANIDKKIENFHSTDKEIIQKTNKKLPTKGNIKAISRTEQRDVVDLSFNVRESHQNEIDVYSLGKALIYTQDLVNFLTLEKKKIGNHKLSKETIQMSRLKAVGFYAASFGVRLESEVETDLFGDTTLSQTLQKFMDLIDSTRNKKKLKENIEKHSLKTTKTYYDFLKILYDNELELIAEWASPSSKYSRSKLDKKVLLNAINILSSETKHDQRIINLVGNLVGINTENHKFNIITDEDLHIHGKMSRELWKETFTIPLKVRAIILEETEINLTTGKEKIQNTLQRIEPIDVV